MAGVSVPTHEPFSSPSTISEPLPLNQLAHDIKNCLGVISMGVDILQNATDEADRQEICDLVRRDGIEPIRALIAQLSATAAFKRGS